jgi:hypothetical protein
MHVPVRIFVLLLSRDAMSFSLGKLFTILRRMTYTI